MPHNWFNAGSLGWEGLKWCGVSGVGLLSVERGERRGDTLRGEYDEAGGQAVRLVSHQNEEIECT